jgi:hypothetical protein
MSVQSPGRKSGISPTTGRTADAVLAKSHPRLSAELTSEMFRLFSSGYSLVPAGGSDGKKAIAAFKDRERLPLPIVMDRMAAGGSNTYGIRLDGLLVIDVDSDTPEATEYVRQGFGVSKFRTLTSRGYHLYFRHSGAKPAAVRLPGITIDFKAGANEYVLGPLSKRPDGVCYMREDRLPAREHLPAFCDRRAIVEPTILSQPGTPVVEGDRHNALKRKCYRLAVSVGSLQELQAEMIKYRDEFLERPSDFSDPKIFNMTRWFWKKRDEGNLVMPGHSSVSIPRSAIDLLARQGQHLAMALYVVLRSAHGHEPTRLFAISPDGLRKSGRLQAGRSQIYAAIDVLVEFGLLERLPSLVRRTPHRYRLIDWSSGGSRKGRSILTLVPGEGTAFDVGKGSAA